MSEIIKKANEYRQKSSNTLYVISFLFGLLIIIAGYMILKAINDMVGLWAANIIPIIIIAIISILAARKL